MSLGEFRRLTAHLPDETDVLMDAEGELEYAEVRIHAILPPVLDHPYALLLETGQVWNEDLDLDARIDAQIGNY